MKFVRLLLIAFLVTLIMKLIFITDFWQKLEYGIQDVHFQLRGPQEVSDEIVIVEIGDNTFSSLNERWPFPRSYYSRLIENLNKAGAKQIIFDVEFTEQSNLEDDRKLAESAAKYDNLIFAGKIIRESSGQFIKEQILPPIRELNELDVLWGTVNISLDRDGFVRRYELYQPVKNGIVYSIGILSLATLHQDSDWEEQINNGRSYFKVRNKFIPKDSSKSCKLNFYGPPGSFTYYDFADVIDDATFDLPLGYDIDSFEIFLENGNFKDKIVLIGASADEFHDSHNTPFSGQASKLMPGVEVHANFIQMALNDDYLTTFSGLYFLIILILAGMFLFLLNYYVKPSRTFFLNILLFIGWLILTYHLFKNEHLIMPSLEIPALIIVMFVQGLVFQYVKTLKERKFIKQAFDQYMAPELVNELIKDPRKLQYGGTQRDITVLFADVRDFTPYTESHSPKEVVTIMQEYLTDMVEILRDNKGTIDKFVGDAIITIFGDPVELDNHAYWACKAALEMRKKFNELQEKWISEKKDIFEIGIGINSGSATVGNLGSRQIFDYTAIGDTMNCGARIEDLNKEYDTKNKILISESTFLLAEKNLTANFIDDVLLRGKKESLKLYELIGLKSEVDSDV
jgi:adenylate cyclase